MNNAAESSAMTEAARPRVLIVDDSRIVRATIIKHVRGRYEFREEVDGEAGWAALQSDPGVQVVISDLGMPKLDGYGLLERIRSSPLSRIRDLPFVIISGDEDEESRRRAKELGATDFITKGIGTVELLARLDSLVKLARAQDELEDSREMRLDNPATGLKTRKLIELQLEQAMSHATRHGLAASVLVLGLDRLDALRGQYGAAAIDQLCLRFGQLLGAKIRREDSLGHVTESTFAVVSPSTGEDGAQIFAGRLREAVELANVGFQGQRIALTVSIGIASGPPDVAADSAALLRLAIARWQSAIDAGGNRIVGCDGKAIRNVGPPRPETALAMLRAGEGEQLRWCAAQLALGIVPLLRMADREYKLGMPLDQIEANLRERAQAEKDARPDVSNPQCRQQ